MRAASRDHHQATMGWLTYGRAGHTQRSAPHSFRYFWDVSLLRYDHPPTRRGHSCYSCNLDTVLPERACRGIRELLLGATKI